MIDFNAQQILVSELEPGERLLWAARPNAQRAFGRQWFFLLFGGCFSGFALFWISGALFVTGASRAMGGPAPFLSFLFPLFGVPFVLVGFGLMAQPFLARKRAQNGACGITDRRAIIIEGATGGIAENFASGARRVRSFGPRDLRGVERRDLSDGNSDVIFARERINSNNGSSWNEIGFWGVPHGREAEQALRALMNPGGSPRHQSNAVDWSP